MVAFFIYQIKTAIILQTKLSYELQQTLQMQIPFHSTHINILLLSISLTFLFVNLAEIFIHLSYSKLYTPPFLPIIFDQHMNNTKDILGQYDFTRSDKFYNLKIPTYHIEEGVVFFEIFLKDLVNNQAYTRLFRFKQIKNMHEALQDKQFQLPPFPKTHFWVKTNKNPQLIEKRRQALESYLSHVINDRFLRGYNEVKKIIKLCKQGNEYRRRLSSSSKISSSPSKERCLSETRSGKAVITRQQWKRLIRSNTLIM